MKQYYTEAFGHYAHLCQSENGEFVLGYGHKSNKTGGQRVYKSKLVAVVMFLWSAVTGK